MDHPDDPGPSLVTYGLRIVLVLFFAFSVGAPLFFQASMWAAEAMEAELAPERGRRLKRCPDDYRLTTRDGKTIYVDRHDRECAL